MKILGIFFLLFLLFIIIIIIITLIIIFVFWLLLIIKEFIKSKVTKKPLRDNYTIGTRNILLIFTFTFITISFIFINPRYEQARQCIILPNGYTIGKGAVFDLVRETFNVKNIVFRDPKGDKLPIDTVSWQRYEIKLNPDEKKFYRFGELVLTDPHLYEFFYSKKEGFVIKARKFDDLSKIYQGDFIENIPQYNNYYIINGSFLGTSVLYDAIKNNPAYPVKNCSIDILKLKKNY